MRPGRSFETPGPGSPPASVLGGINLAISAYSKNPEAAAAFIDFAAGEANQKEDFLLSSNPPTVGSVYEDPEITKEFAFAPDLKKAIEQGQSRPVTPVYSQVSEAIYDNVYSALQGKVSADEAVTTMQSDIEKALETF
ncbi:MAG TPA: extracellular solute-binding protein [Thermoleophilaceae bacterium]|nr:extracellular solute-binding protein [Thermoleophilaceae bacterium]